MPLDPMHGELDQRYWRRRANRRVRKARRARTLYRWSVIVLVNGLVAAVLLFAGARAFRHLTTSSYFAVERIELLGSERTSAARIRAAVTPYIGRNLLELNLYEIERIVRHDPWVRRALVRRVLPNMLRITLSERRPCAVALIGGVAHLVDDTGYVIGPTGPGRADDLPVLSGLAGLERGELVAALTRGVALLRQLANTSRRFTLEISEFDLSRRDRVTVRTVAPGPRILLDPQRIDRNVEQYLALRGEIEIRVGAADYVDLRWKDRIAVMPERNAG